jgi:hypothetical protein
MLLELPESQQSEAVRVLVVAVEGLKCTKQHAEEALAEEEEILQDREVE